MRGKFRPKHICFTYDLIWLLEINYLCFTYDVIWLLEINYLCFTYDVIWLLEIKYTLPERGVFHHPTLQPCASQWHQRRVTPNHYLITQEYTLPAGLLKILWLLEINYLCFTYDVIWLLEINYLCFTYDVIWLLEINNWFLIAISDHR
jgi:hypothetical protein